MSSPLAVWIDSSQAKFFKFNENGVETTHMKPHGPIHHIETLGMNHTKAEGDTERFYHQVAEYLQKDPDYFRQLFIVPSSRVEIDVENRTTRMKETIKIVQQRP